MMELYIDKGLRIALKDAESGARLGGEGRDGLKEVVDGHLTVELGFEIDEVGIAYHIVVTKAERAVACFVLGCSTYRIGRISSKTDCREW